MPMDTLFEELIDQVVEFVCLDREESVARLALLGRQWVPPTRRRLFHSLWIQAPERWEQSKKRHRQLLILLDNKHCSIHPYVRLVHISGTVHILGEASRPSHAEWLKPIFQHLPKWTSADSLRFSYIDSQTLNSNAWKQLFAGEVHDQGGNQFKKKVVDLCLYHVPFNSIDDTLSILNIVSGFPALQRLRMEPQVASLKSFPLRCGEAGISAPEYSLRQPPLLLDTLDLTQNPENPTGFPHDVFWNWLSAGSVKLRNLTLGLEGMDDAALRALARYLQYCGSLLTQFTLKAGSFDEFAIFGVQVKGRKEIRPSIEHLVASRVLARMVCLEELKIHSLFLFKYSIHHGCPYSLIPINLFVSTLSGQMLQRLELYVAIDNSSHGIDIALEHRSWHSADMILAGDTFPVIRELMIVVTVRGLLWTSHHGGGMLADGEQDVAECFRGLLPQCAANKVLAFSFKYI